MKKFLALATLLVTLLALPLTAGAERSGWKSNTFPFKRLKVVYLKDLSRQDGGFQKAHPAFIRDDDAVRKTFLTLQRDLKKEGVTLYNNPVMLPDKQLRNTITLQVQVNHVGTEPATTGAEVTTDRKGQKLTSAGTSYASLSFLATKNGTPIYQVTDERTSSEYTSDTLLAGIIREAADELTKDAKK